MRDADFWVRNNAGRSLASHGEAGAEAVPAIIRLLRTEDRNLRGAAAETLGKFGPSAQEAIAALLVALNDEKEHVRRSAEEALNAVSPIESATAAEAVQGAAPGRPFATLRCYLRPGPARVGRSEAGRIEGPG